MPAQRFESCGLYGLLKRERVAVFDRRAVPLEYAVTFRIQRAWLA
jgi:hypothetical protein